MTRDNFYVVFSHYDGDGHKSRLVVKVNGEVFSYKGYKFGLYQDEKEGLWKLVDVATGKKLTESKSRLQAMTRITIPEVFSNYQEITKLPSYPELKRELTDLVKGGCAA